MARSARACVLIGIMFSLQPVGAAEKDITGLEQALNMLSKQLDSAKTEQTTNSSFENHAHNSLGGNNQSNIDSYLRPAITTFLKYFEDDRRFHRDNYHKLETAISRLGADVDALKAARTQEFAERHTFLQVLNGVKKEQEETKVQIAVLHQKIDDVVQENKHQNQSTVANSQRIERLVQRVEELKQEILTTVDGVVSQAEERHINKYKTLIQEAVDNREKCQSGDWVGPHSFNPGPSYPSTVTVFFEPHFNNTPALVYGLKLLDSNQFSNVRMNTNIVELTNTHFKMTINRWADTVMYGAVFNWMACPK